LKKPVINVYDRDLNYFKSFDTTKKLAIELFGLEKSPGSLRNALNNATMYGGYYFRWSNGESRINHRISLPQITIEELKELATKYTRSQIAKMYSIKYESVTWLFRKYSIIPIIQRKQNKKQVNLNNITN